MKNHVIGNATAIVFFLFLVGFPASSVSAQEYEALRGIQTVKTIFDFRDGDTEIALIHLNLVHDTYKDQAIRSVSKAPEFVVVFMDVAVLLLSDNREKFSDQEKERLEKFDKTISALAKDGVRLEVCMFAVSALGVDPATIAPEIHRVGNGWIASLGYQQRGYSLVPAY